MHKLKFVSVFVLLALLLSVGSGTVMAKKPPPDLSDPEAVGALVEQLAMAGDNADELWAKLSPDAQAAVVAYLRPARAERFVEVGSLTVGEGSAYPLGGGSKEYTLGYEQYNAYGMLLWRYGQKIRWDYDGSNITSKTRDRCVQVFAPFWEFA